MRQAITISSSRDLQKFRQDFVQLIEIVRNANGKYVLHVESPRSFATHPTIISKSDFDRVFSPAMHGEPAAFSHKIAGGRFTPERLDRAYNALTREQIRKQYAGQHQQKILNRKDYIAYYYPDFSFYPKLAASLSK